MSGTLTDSELQIVKVLFSQFDQPPTGHIDSDKACRILGAEEGQDFIAWSDVDGNEGVDEQEFIQWFADHKEVMGLAFEPLLESFQARVAEALTTDELSTTETMTATAVFNRFVDGSLCMQEAAAFLGPEDAKTIVSHVLGEGEHWNIHGFMRWCLDHKCLMGPGGLEAALLGLEACEPHTEEKQQMTSDILSIKELKLGLGLFSRFDQNKDGYICYSEASVHLGAEEADELVTFFDGDRINKPHFIQWLEHHKETLGGAFPVFMQTMVKETNGTVQETNKELNLTEEEKDHVRSIFDRFDHDCDGVISIEEAAYYLGPEEAKDLMHWNNSDEIAEYAFMEWCSEQKENMGELFQEELLGGFDRLSSCQSTTRVESMSLQLTISNSHQERARAIFNMFDYNGDGHVSADEAARFLGTLEAEDLVAWADSDDNGEIDENEFLHWCESRQRDLGANVLEQILKGMEKQMDMIRVRASVRMPRGTRMVSLQEEE